MKRIYISGSGGMLGDAFYNHFKHDNVLKCTDINVNEDWLGFCDMRDYDEYRKDVIDFKPDYLFHLGALTDLEYCELHPDDAYLTNILAVENAVYISRELRIPILYISTAGIFDGNKESYDDWDMPNPIGVYARSKYAGELFVREHADRYIICRPGWMMGGGPGKDKKFIGKIMSQIQERRTELFVVTDKMGSPSYSIDCAKNVELLINHKFWGVYNMMCSGMTNKFEIAREIISILRLEESVSIKGVNSDYFKDIYFAPRPASEMLINRKLILRNLNVMRNWKISLKEYLESNFYK